MKTQYIGPYQVPDGYFGENTIIHLCFDPKTCCCIEVHPSGYFRSCVPPALNSHEVRWLISNHPACNARIKELNP